MPIDFTGLYGQSVPPTRAATANVAPPEALLRGDITTALVTRVAPVDASTRELLMARAAHTELKLAAELSRPAASPSPNTAPGPQTRSASTASPPPSFAEASVAAAKPAEPRQKLNALLAQPALQLAALRVRGQTFTTLTDQPLQKGQQVLVQLNSERQLQLVSTSRPAPAATVSPDPVPRPETAGLRGDPAPSTAVQRPQLEISEALRQLLPQRDRPALLSQLATAQRTLRHLPPGQGREQLQQLLQQLARVPLEAPNLQASEAGSVRRAVETSGVFFEQRLARMVSGASRLPDTALSPLLNSDTKALLLRAVHLTRPEVLPTLVSPPLPSPHPPGQGAPTPSAQGKASPPPPVSAAEWQQAAEGVKSQSLPGLLQLLAQTPPASADMRQLQIQLVVLLHQASLTNLARIRTGQLTSEPAQTRGVDGAPAQQPAGLNLELSVRYHGELHPLHMRIEEEAEDEQGHATRAEKQSRAWRVNLRMETPAVGEFYAQLHYLAGNLKVNFWSEQIATLDEAREKFHPLSRALASAGIAVDHVLYHHGKPAHDNNQLSYALVDIKT